MPFKSRKQSRWAFANKKPWARKWGKMTNYKKLPQRVRGTKSRRKKG